MRIARHPRQLARDLERIEQIRRLTIAALVSIDTLFERLALKGGNAIPLIGAKFARHSIDLDFSVNGTLEDLGGINELQEFFDKLLTNFFSPHGFTVFDVSIEKRPPVLNEDVLGDFWGGHRISFKVLANADFAALDENQRRRRSIAADGSNRRSFIIDLSHNEYCGDTRVCKVDDYNVNVYSERLLVCEKIRAICQQMPEYRVAVHSPTARPRARDFFDIHNIATSLVVDFSSDEFWNTLCKAFEAKRVALSLLGMISDHREFHRENFEQVRSAVSASTPLKEFDFYVGFLVDRLAPLEPRWKEYPPLT